MAKLTGIVFALTLTVAGCDFNSEAMSPHGALQSGTIANGLDDSSEAPLSAPKQQPQNKAGEPAQTAATPVVPAETRSRDKYAEHTLPETRGEDDDAGTGETQPPTTPEEETGQGGDTEPVETNPVCGNHDRFGQPGVTDALLCRTDYLVGYNAVRKAADWVAYHVTAEGAAEDIERTDDFRADKELEPSAQSQLSDYKGSGFDRGHMFPAALATSDDAMSETFLLSNITPQLPGFNRYGWKELEAWVRDCAEKVGEIDVVTGTVYDADLTHIGDQVQIADAFYKIVHHNGKTQAFLVMHAKADMDDVAYWEITEEELEKITGHSFFPGKATVDGTVCTVL